MPAVQSSQNQARVCTLLGSALLFILWHFSLLPSLYHLLFLYPKLQPHSVTCSITNALPLKWWSMDQLHQHHQGIQQCKVSGSIPASKSTSDQYPQIPVYTTSMSRAALMFPIFPEPGTTYGMDPLNLWMM